MTSNSWQVIDTDLTAGNIKNWANIFGVVWTYSGPSSSGGSFSNIIWQMTPVIWYRLNTSAIRGDHNLHRAYDDWTNVYIFGVYAVTNTVSFSSVTLVFMQVSIAKVNKTTWDISYFLSDPINAWVSDSHDGWNPVIRAYLDGTNMHITYLTPLGVYRYVTFAMSTDEFVYNGAGSAISSLFFWSLGLDRYTTWDYAQNAFSSIKNTFVATPWGTLYSTVSVALSWYTYQSKNVWRAEGSGADKSGTNIIFLDKTPV